MSEELFTPEEYEKYEKLAKSRGFDSLRDYVLMLIKRDIEQHGGLEITEGDN